VNQIKCTKCNEVFTIDETSYNNILKQVRDNDFALAVKEKSEQLRLQHQKDLEIADVRAQTVLKTALAEKETTIANLQNEVDNFDREKEIVKQLTQAEMKERINELEQLNLKLGSQIKEVQKEKELEFNQVIANKERDYNELKSELTTMKSRFDDQKKIAVQETEKSLQTEISTLKEHNTKLKNEVATVVKEKDFELIQKMTDKEREIDNLNSQLEAHEIKSKLEKTAIKERYEVQLKDRDNEITRIQEFKAKQNVKLLGESLEQHCENSFNSIRMTAFPRAEFGKDSDVSTGTKGDYIYREYDEFGTEIISIMFEMKNEASATATKKKNDDFLAKLHKDRNDKVCEYAILVSVLESENEFYNNGIVDVSYRYPKMYVIRPQFFIPIITLLRNAALKSAEYKNEVELIKQQNIDVVNFEDKLTDFKKRFGMHYLNSSKQFETATKEIDNAIDHLNKIKEALRLTTVHLGRANTVAEDLSVKKLVRGNKTMKAEFEKTKLIANDDMRIYQPHGEPNLVLEVDEYSERDGVEKGVIADE